MNGRLVEAVGFLSSLVGLLTTAGSIVSGGEILPTLHIIGAGTTLALIGFIVGYAPRLFRVSPRIVKWTSRGLAAAAGAAWMIIYIVVLNYGNKSNVSEAYVFDFVDVIGILALTGAAIGGLLWWRAHSKGPETKTCPDCANDVLAAARKCQHCGYRFDATVSS